jgi:hypothetical protein
MSPATGENVDQTRINARENQHPEGKTKAVLPTRIEMEVLMLRGDGKNVQRNSQIARLDNRPRTKCCCASKEENKTNYMNEIYSDDIVTVTDKIVTVKGTAYATAQINSVRIIHGPVSIIAVLLGGLFMIGIIASISEPKRDAGTIATQGFLFTCCMAYAILKYRNHALTLATSSGEVTALKCSNITRLESIRAAIIQAMAR